MALHRTLPIMSSKAKKKMLSNMEKNTVILDLDTYNSLRDFKTEILEGKTYVFYTAYNGYVTDRNPKFITTDEIIIALSKENEKFGKKDEAHDLELKRLRDEFSKEREKNIQLTKDLGSAVEKNNKITETLLGIRKMSIWGFMRWR